MSVHRIQHGSGSQNFMSRMTQKQINSKIVSLAKNKAGRVNNSVEWATSIIELSQTYTEVNQLLQPIFNIVVPNEQLQVAHLTDASARSHAQNSKFLVQVNGANSEEEILKQEKQKRNELAVELVMEKITAAMNKSSTTQTILGVEMPLLFIDPMTAVLQESVFDYGDIEFRPKSKIKMIIPELGFARVGTEDQSRRHWRSLLWNSLTNSCKDVISEHVWKDIKKGDCAKLHLRISEHAQANNRREIIRDVNSKFIELRKKKSETFKGFISRYQSICITASRIGYNLDKDYCLLTIYWMLFN